MLFIFNARYRKVMYLISKSSSRCLVNPSTDFHAFPCRNITEEKLRPSSGSEGNTVQYIR